MKLWVSDFEIKTDKGSFVVTEQDGDINVSHNGRKVWSSQSLVRDVSVGTIQVPLSAKDVEPSKDDLSTLLSLSQIDESLKYWDKAIQVGDGLSSTLVRSMFQFLEAVVETLRIEHAAVMKVLEVAPKLCGKPVMRPGGIEGTCMKFENHKGEWCS